MLKDLIVIILLAVSCNAFAQDMEFSQYHASPLYLNPAMAGSNGTGRAAAGHRMQWPGFDHRDTVFFKGYNTSFASYDHYLHKIRSGIGVMYMYSTTPYKVFTTHHVELDYAAHFRIKIDSLRQVVIRPGVSFAYNRKELDWNMLSFGDMFTPNLGFIHGTEEQSSQRKIHYGDLGAGLLIYSKHIIGGLSVRHILEPNEAFQGASKLPMKYVLHMAGNIGNIDSLKFIITPHVLYIKQHDFWQLLTGASFRYDKYSIGLAYRINDALVMQAGFELPLFKVSYNYDHTVSGLGSSVTRGSHELMLSFNILHRKEKEILPLRTAAF